MEGVFITGTDTNVGKTVISAGLLKALHGFQKACYWKPIQTGTIVGDDTNDIRNLLEFGTECFMEPAYRFPEPLAPRHAAKKWGKTIDLDGIVRQFHESKEKDRFVIVEGAGGLLVTINDQYTQKDLIKQLGLAVMLVAEDRIGAINHTLLTLECCKASSIPVLGVVLTKAKGTYGNADSIAHFGKVEILAEFPPNEDSFGVVAQVSCNPRLRELLHVPPIPT